MDRSKKAPILVLGGTGPSGRAIVASLLRMERAVRVLSRNAANGRRLLGDAVEIVSGDVTSREAVRRALAGVEAVVISISAFAPRLIRKLELIERDSILSVLDEAKGAGISRIVYLSVPHEPGNLSELARELGRAGINIHHAYTATARDEGACAFVLAVIDPRAAEKVLE